MLILFILIIISGNCTLDIIAPKKDSEVKMHLEIIGSTHSCANIHQLFGNAKFLNYICTIILQKD